jgi:hypothetical protein
VLHTGSLAPAILRLLREGPCVVLSGRHGTPEVNIVCSDKPCMTCVAEAMSCPQTEAAYMDGISVAFARLRNLHAHQLHHHAGECQAYYTYLARAAPEKDALVRRSASLADG